MRVLRAWWPAGLLVLVLLSLAASRYAASRWEDQNVPPRWRADRWEVSPGGEEAWEWMKRLCPPAGDEAWIRFEPGDPMPWLDGAPAEAAACFSTKIAPRYAPQAVPAH